jgi:diguanylate cyclase (GGDEF)-like protein
LADELSATRRLLRAALRRNNRLVARCRNSARELASTKGLLERAYEFAYYDELTGLANRRLLLERVTRALTLAKRHEQQLMLLFVDLDGFKKINDEFGHTIGDSLIQQVATRLSAAVRASDTVCRYGGDEFVVLLTEIKHPASARTVVAKICGSLATPYDIDGTSIAMSVSHGAAVYPDDGQLYGDLLQQSDFAMYRYKSRNRTNPRIHRVTECPMTSESGRGIEPGKALRHPRRRRSFTG